MIGCGKLCGKVPFCCGKACGKCVESCGKHNPTGRKGGLDIIKGATGILHLTSSSPPA